MTCIRMRVLYIVPRLHPNHSTMISELQRNGWEINFWVSKIGKLEDHSVSKPELLPVSFASSVLLRLVSPNDLNSPLTFPSFVHLYTRILELSPDFVVIRNPLRMVALQGALICRMLKIPFTIYTQTPRLKTHSRWKKYMLATFCRFFRCTWYTPLAFSYQTLSSVDHPPSYLEYVPFPIICKTDTASLSNAEVSETLNILMIGKFEARKRHKFLLSAVSELKQGSKKINVFIAGEASLERHFFLRSEIEHIASHLNHENLEIVVLSNLTRAEMNKLYARCDILVIPSTNEPASISILEAMGFGLVVISTFQSGTACYLMQNESGLLFDEDDGDALRNYLQDLIDDEQRLLALKCGALISARNNFTPKNFYISFTRLFDKSRALINDH